MHRNDLLIIGGGAAGLMAAAAAGEHGLSCILLEKRHRPGLKLLMCGNNRCNVSHASDAAGMIAAYGEVVGDFLEAAMRAFPPRKLQAWFQQAGLRTVIKRDRIYPETENADDVLHCFLDKIRELKVPVSLNSSVESIDKQEDGEFIVKLENGMELTARNLLLATGGVSFPKTGSTGDGLKLAAKLGHKVTPLRPGLAGMEISGFWMEAGRESDIPDAVVRLSDKSGFTAETRGNILCSKGVLRGSAIFDSSRIAAREQLQNFQISADLFPEYSIQKLENALNGRRDAKSLTASFRQLGLPPELAEALAQTAAGRKPGELAAYLKNMQIPVTGVRPLKEAIVTAGGVALDQINSETMESKICPGLYFAGEVMDVDGPTGGYNLHAAFSTARLAVENIAGKTGRSAQPHRHPLPEQEKKRPSENRRSWNRDREQNKNSRYAPEQKQTPRDRYGDPRSASRPFNSRRKTR